MFKILEKAIDFVLGVKEETKKKPVMRPKKPKDRVVRGVAVQEHVPSYMREEYTKCIMELAKNTERRQEDIIDMANKMYIDDELYYRYSLIRHVYKEDSNSYMEAYPVEHTIYFHDWTEEKEKEIIKCFKTITIDPDFKGEE